jgi:hypothetical protein
MIAGLLGIQTGRMVVADAARDLRRSIHDEFGIQIIEVCAGDAGNGGGYCRPSFDGCTKAPDGSATTAACNQANHRSGRETTDAASTTGNEADDKTNDFADHQANDLAHDQASPIADDQTDDLPDH